MSLESLEPQAPGPEPEHQALLCEALVTGASDAIMGFDPDGSIVLWNDGCEALYGWTAAEMLGGSASVLVPDARRGELERVLHALAGRPEPAALETLRLHRSGTVLAVSCRVSPMIDHAGRVIGASAVVRDNSREIELRQELGRSRSLAEARFDQSVVAQATLNPSLVIIDVNPALCRLLGYAQKQLLGRPVVDLFPESERDAAKVQLRRVRGGKPAVSRTPRLVRHAEGHLVETRVSLFAVRDEPTGEVLRLEAVVEDISSIAAAERELQLREVRWQSLAANSADVALFCAENGELLFVSSSVTSRFGYSPDGLLGADGFSFLHPEDEPCVRSLWEEATKAPVGTTCVIEARVRHVDGSWRWAQQSVTNRLADPAVGAMVVNLADISDRKSAEAVLAELSGLDALTGLATRTPLMAVLDAAFASGRAERTAVAVVDLTRLKLVNDAFGQRGGDDLLRETGRRLEAVVGGRGVVARIGGDEFAVMLSEVAEISDLFESVAELLTTIERPLDLGGQQVTMTASVGAALGPAVDAGALLASAESALTTAKEGLTGPMHVMRAESSSAGMMRARLIEDLRRGLEQDELVVHFQPVVSLSEGRPVAAEALVRWAHPDKGLLSPGAFISAAEDSGLIVQVGHKVLTAACEAAARWSAAGDAGTPFHVAVNLSARQLTGGGVVAAVHDALTASGAPPAALMLEVTESAVMSDVEAAVQTLQELREMGVAIAMDDFGTGYSSLTYLKQFPVTALKIDRSFVSGLGQNADDAAIVSYVIKLAQAMGLDCIAEGVETEQQRLVLQALGCAYGQGFLWSPAVDVSAFEVWLGAAAPAAGGAASAEDASKPPTLSVPTNAEVLRRLTELRDAGASLNTIAAALNAEQLTTAQGKRWTSHSVASTLGGLPRH